MMYVTCTLSGIEDIADPRFRVIKFGDAAAQKVVVSLLRRGWGALPPVDIEAADDLDKAARAALNSWMSSAQNKAWVEGGMPPIEAENSDKDSVDTPWRMAVLYYYNHLFYDIGNMLPEVNCAMGRFSPPNHTSFVLKYEDLTSEEPYVHTFDTNVVVLPAFLDDGVKLQVSQADEAEPNAGEELGVFDDEHMMEAFFIKRKMPVSFKLVNGESDEATSEGISQRAGVAGVFVVGILDANI